MHSRTHNYQALDPAKLGTGKWRLLDSTASGVVTAEYVAKSRTPIWLAGELPIGLWDDPATDPQQLADAIRWPRPFVAAEWWEWQQVKPLYMKLRPVRRVELRGS